MSKHTPGPWTIVPSKTILKYELRRADTTTAWYRPEHEANARLIAAAPDLLEALQWVARCCKGYTKSSQQEMHLDDILAAIAKATGADQ